jgi:predicted anti-sigma-YlaC factor YlaD
VNCDEVREQLSDHLLATLPETKDARVRRHLRGCGACRTELGALEEGLSLFSQAAHHSVPPPELETRVLAAIEEEWRETAPDARVAHDRPVGIRRRFGAWAVAAAMVLAVAVSLGWGVGQAHRADRAEVGAASYSRLLDTLGGREFRVGELQGTTGHDVSGSIILYDSVWDRSWAAVFIRAPGSSGTLAATLTGPDGRELSFDPIRTVDGEGDGWLVTSEDVRRFDRLTVRDASGAVVASAQIASA